ncbi:hypothetical protein KJ641_01350 [Patescibacteria group bacterium]|nr:hypothetical protein [Patescibacteria group bacterium]MBU1895497.1 hypothetical protein [Patescibacteria group bacterium]
MKKIIFPCSLKRLGLVKLVIKIIIIIAIGPLFFTLVLLGIAIALSKILPDNEIINSIVSAVALLTTFIIFKYLLDKSVAKTIFEIDYNEIKIYEQIINFKFSIQVYHPTDNIEAIFPKQILSTNDFSLFTKNKSGGKKIEQHTIIRFQSQMGRVDDYYMTKNKLELLLKVIEDHNYKVTVLDKLPN